MTGTAQELPKANDNNKDGTLGQPSSMDGQAGDSKIAIHPPLGQEALPYPVRGLHSENSISIAVDPVALITTECITVTSAMRKHARWAQSSVSAILGGGGALDSGRGSISLPKHMKGGSSHRIETSQTGRLSNGLLREDDGLTGRWGLRGKKGKSMQDNPLMSAFARLRSDLRGCSSKSTHSCPLCCVLMSL